MIRFNQKGKLNIPFCRNPQRFSQSYITKIINQILHLVDIFTQQKIEFKYQDFKKTILIAKQQDIIYCDPPYIDRYCNYYNKWNADDELTLFKLLSNTKAKFIVSTWHHNNYLRK